MKKYPAKIFYCYSHKDETLNEQLEVHLKIVINNSYPYGELEY